MYTDLDPSIDCFTTDAPPTTLYTNAPLGIALESKGCNYAASPNMPYQLVTFVIKNFFFYNLGCHCSISHCGGHEVPSILMHMARHFSVYRSTSPVACLGENTAIMECQQQMFVIDWSARDLLRLASGHPQSQGAPRRWLPSTVICFPDMSNQ